jgi:hypothetical protein
MLNHKVSDDQVVDARMSLGVDEIIYAPKDIMDLWGNVPPEASITELKEYLQPIINWVETLDHNSVLLLQGESTSTFQIVRFMQKKYSLTGTICVAATSRRETIEEKLNDGSIKKTAIFKHVRFRPYF